MQLRIPFEDTIPLINSIPHTWINDDRINTKWTPHYIEPDGQNGIYGRMSAPAVCWLYCWAMTGKDSEDAKERSIIVFNEIFEIKFERYPREMNGKFHVWARRVRNSNPTSHYDEQLSKVLNIKENTTMQQTQSNTNKYDEYIKLLNANHNLILTGAPGTGKTYLAKQIAKQIIFGDPDKELVLDEDIKKLKEQCAFVQFHPSYDYTDFVEGLRPTEPDNDGNIGFELKDGIFKTFCYNAIKYEIDEDNVIDNFDEAYKKLLAKFSYPDDTLSIPLISGNGMFEIQQQIKGDGLISKRAGNERYNFPKDQLYRVYVTEEGKPRSLLSYMKAIIKYMKDNCELKPYVKSNKSKAVEGKKDFIFIIDEINRGEISKIFGELFFSIDPGYRGPDGKVKTQYQNMQDDEDFYVPESVYIIGTMNDIDRSVESFDFAMRRRFTWKEITAKDSQIMFKDKSWKNEAIIRMDALNKAIWDEEKNKGIEGLNASYHIGGAYFLKLEKYPGEADPFKKLWQYHLEPLLKEYLRGMPDSDVNIKKLEKAYNKELDLESTADNEESL